MEAGKFTVCVLGYDAYTMQLERCLGSIYARLPHPRVAEVRVGINHARGPICLAAERFLFDDPESVSARLIIDSEAEAKYPMMRRLFYEAPIRTEFVMWFDDDSWIKPDYPYDFFEVRAAQLADNDLVGKRYRQRLRHGQAEWIEAQPWYSGVRVESVVEFMQGAWWAARTSRIRDWDYPWPELYHNGGDVMLGALSRQQKWRKLSDNAGVAINADDGGNESKGPRRGLSRTPRPIGATPDE